MDFEEACHTALRFRDVRDWKQFHNPKDLALSISLEASELLEVFQWSGDDTSADGREDRICEELADVAIYCIYLADAIGVELPDVIAKKIAANEAKYPVENAKGSSKKYTEFV